MRFINASMVNPKAAMAATTVATEAVATMEQIRHSKNSNSRQ